MAAVAVVNEIHDWLSTVDDDVLRLLEELVEVESPSTGTKGTRQVLERLDTELRDIAYDSVLEPGENAGGCLVAFPRGFEPGEEGQLLVGHGDTVWPVGTLADRPWRNAGDHIYGPGIFDMKAGLVQIVFALKALDALGLVPPCPPVVIINSDEEIGSRESTATIERLARTASRAFILEPGLGPHGDMKTARKGIGKYTIDITGRASHAGLDPEAGASAILELSSVVQRLFALNDHDRGITVNVGTIEGGIRSNVVAPHSQAVVDTRVLHHDDAVALDATIRAMDTAIEGTEMTIEGGFGRPPMERTEGNVQLFEAARAIGEDLGMEFGEVTAGGGSDGNTTSQYVPTLDGLGIIGDGAHAESEHIITSLFLPRIALLGSLLLHEEE